MHAKIAALSIDVSALLPLLPHGIPGLVLLLAAGLAAVGLSRLVMRLLLRRPETSPVHMIAVRTQGLIRMALIAAALEFALPATGFSPTAMSVIARLLLGAEVLLTGWGAVLAVDVFSELYLRRWHIEVADNLAVRKHVTGIRILRRACDTLIVILAIAAALMTFPVVRQYGVGLFASAGAAGLVVGLAARPLLANLIAGLEIALTQPIRVEDAVVVEGEWGWIEEIASTYVVVRIWDWRHMILPLSYFIEHPFQNWTRESASLIGAVHLFVDYTLPVEPLRAKVTELAKANPLWDGRVVNLQVVEATEKAIQLRVLVSARNSSDAWDLRCQMREQLIEHLQRACPHALPKYRAEMGQSVQVPAG